MTQPATLPGKPVRRRTIEGDKDKLTLSRGVEVVDDTRLELKLNYGLPDGVRKVRYRVQVFFFFPGSLDLGPMTYPKRDFYSDLSAYVRLRTPELSLGEFVDKANQSSPLCRLHELVDQIPNAGRRRQILLEEMASEAKLYGCLARVYMRDRRLELLRRIQKLATGKKKKREQIRQALPDRVRNMLTWAELILEEYRRVRDALAGVLTEEDQPGVENLDQIDEFLSYTAERSFGTLLLELEPVDPAMAEQLRGLIREVVQAEVAHRERRGYFPIPVSTEENDVFLHRQRLLRKYVSSALFLDLDPRDVAKEYSDWIGALAAGLAMAFATLAYFFLKVQGLTHMDAALLSTIILVYVFKDRIKDIVKRKLSPESSSWFSDLDTRIFHRRFGAQLGRCRENTRWLRQKQIWPLIERIRSHKSRISRNLRRATGESVLCYDKQVELYPRKIGVYHQRHDGVTDIIRIGLDRLRRNMDLPETSVTSLDPETGQVMKLPSQKNYVVNLVIRYTLPGQEAHYEKIRVVLDKERLQRVERVIRMRSESEMQELLERSNGNGKGSTRLTVV